MQPINSSTQLLSGTIITSIYFLRDSDGLVDDDSMVKNQTCNNEMSPAAGTLCKTTSVDHISGYFAFGDLNIKPEGSFRILFTLYEAQASDDSLRPTMKIVSDKFVVYSAKKFPGMTESSELCEWLAEQGVRIRIRKETCGRRRRSSTSSAIQRSATALKMADSEDSKADSIKSRSSSSSSYRSSSRPNKEAYDDYCKGLESTNNEHISLSPTSQPPNVVDLTRKRQICKDNEARNSVFNKHSNGKRMYQGIISLQSKPRGVNKSFRQINQRNSSCTGHNISLGYKFAGHDMNTSSFLIGSNHGRQTVPNAAAPKFQKFQAQEASFSTSTSCDVAHRPQAQQQQQTRKQDTQAHKRNMSVMALLNEQDANTRGFSESPHGSPLFNSQPVDTRTEPYRSWPAGGSKAGTGPPARTPSTSLDITASSGMSDSPPKLADPSMLPDQDSASRGSSYRYALKSPGSLMMGLTQSPFPAAPSASPNPPGEPGGKLLPSIHKLVARIA